MSSDNIPELCINSPGQVYSSIYTDKVICGQYTSLSTIIHCNTSFILVVQFSGDGTNWDFQTTTTIPAHTNKMIVTTVQAKWIKFTCNIAPNEIYIDALRLYTYGTPTNSSVLAQLTKIGGVNPTVNIGNLPPNFATPTTLLRYKFQGSAPVTPTSSTFTSIYPTLYINNQGVDPGTFSYANGFLRMGAVDDAGGKVVLATVQDTPYNLPTGAATVKFSYICSVPLPQPDGTKLLVGAMSNFGDVVAVGQRYTGTNNIYHWGLFLQTQGYPIWIPHEDFNVDPCDGTGSLPTFSINATQFFQIVITAQAVLLYIQYNGVMNLIHVVNATDLTTPDITSARWTMTRDFSIGYFHRVEIQSGVGSGNTIYCGCGDWELQSIGTSSALHLPNNSRKNCYGTTKSSIIAEANVVTFQNYSVYQTQSLLRTATLSNICLTRNTPATPCTFNIYRNANITSPSHVTINSYTNVRRDTTGGFNGGGFLLQTVTMGPDTSTIILSNQYDFKADDTITITAQAATAIEVAVSVNIE